MKQSKNNWPNLPTDEAAREFVATADLSAFDWSAAEAAEPVTHEFESKSAQVNMRMPESQLARIKAEAQKRGKKYQPFMRELMERGLQTLSQ